MLVGSEVKSLRNGRVSLDEAYARVKEDEVWLVGCDIAEYVEANRFNHQPRRPRKLLLHRREVKRFAHRAFEKGLTLVPLEMHFKRGLAKVVLGICRGKQQHDKREAMKKAEAKRDMARQICGEGKRTNCRRLRPWHRAFDVILLKTAWHAKLIASGDDEWSGFFRDESAMTQPEAVSR